MAPEKKPYRAAIENTAAVDLAAMKLRQLAKVAAYETMKVLNTPM